MPAHLREPEADTAPSQGASESKLSGRLWGPRPYLVAPPLPGGPAPTRWPRPYLVASRGLNAIPTPRPREGFAGEEAEAGKAWVT